MAATLEELERRVIALEKAQLENTATLKWVSGTLGQIQALQDHHTDELREIRNDMRQMRGDIRGLDGKIDAVDRKVDAVDRKVGGLAATLPGLIGEAVRAATKPG
jgi:chromosome segregation ATPase